MKFWQRTRMIMKQKGISQNELARRAGLSSSGISTTLSEEGNPRESSMASIYEALNMTPEEFWSNGIPAASLSTEQSHLISIFDQLNEAGQGFLISQAESILSQPAFRKAESTASAI